MDLSIITVIHNDKDQILGQIPTVALAAKNICLEQFIVDNASLDGATDAMAQNYPHLNIIKNQGNLGFGRANNQAAALAAGEFFLFLNPDMRLAENSLDKLIDWMRARPDVGIASCKLTDVNGAADNNAAPRRFPTLFDQLMIVLKIPHLFPGVLKNYFYSNFDFEREREVDSVRGSFMLMRRTLYEKLGWAFDPRYFIWFEDVDVCRECKKLGMKVVYTPVISCVDLYGQSFKKMPFIWKQKRFTTSMIKYFWKWKK